VSTGIGRKNTITRKNLVCQTGLIIGVIGVPLGWVAHRFYAEQRLADVLICRERTETLPETQLEMRFEILNFLPRHSSEGVVNPTEPLGTIV